MRTLRLLPTALPEDSRRRWVKSLTIPLASFGRAVNVTEPTNN
jgi:hypothetical protein